MINNLIKEPCTKKSISIILISVFISLGVLNIFQIYQLNNVYKQHLYTEQNIVGSLVLKYPDEEDKILSSIKNSNEHAQNTGKEILESYGYNEHNNILNDDKYDSIIKNSIFISMSITIFLAILNLAIVGKVMNYMLGIFINISSNIDKMTKGDYLIDASFEKEGIEHTIYSQLSILGKNLELGFEKLNKEKENIKALVTDISHQLKTPLSSLKLNNSLIMEENDDEDMRMLFLIKNEEIIQKLNNLIDALVNISRLEASMISIKIGNKNIKDTIIKSISSSYTKALEKDIELELNEFEDIYVEHDARWSEEAIFNVIENAIKYSDPKSKIYIDVSKTINYVRIDIKDSGIGIKKEDYNEIFKRFYRGTSKEVKYTEGSGVGLYLSRKILEKQGGNIIVKSEIGNGSKFSLFFQL
ncbi:MAG: sensor histidine kinase [Paraclostridium sp.]|uniref:sensor histidine kinase n=1 Tax=Paraclostridium sp. TaxID=2023273 RepID=UPI003F3CEEAF